MFYKEVDDLKELTGEEKLNKMIATIMQTDYLKIHPY